MVAKRKVVDSIAAPKNAPVIALTEQGPTLLARSVALCEGGNSSVIDSEVSLIAQTRGEQREEGSDSVKAFVNPFGRHKRLLLIILGTFLIIISVSGLATGGVYAYQKRYTDTIYPGVRVWGEEVGGKDVTQLQEVITEKTKAYTLTLKGPDQDYTATAEDLGVIFNSEAMITTAMGKGRTGAPFKDAYMQARLLSGKISLPEWQKLTQTDKLAVAPTYSVNQEIFDKYVAKMAENINIAAQDSEVKVVAGKVNLKPAIYGRQVNVDELRAEIRRSVDGFVAEQISITTTTTKPAIIDTAAQEVMVQAQNVMKRPVILSYKGVDYQPNQETVASWISFTKGAGDAKYTLVVDPANMKGYFDFLGTKINIAAIPRKVRVENETKETETQAGANGLAVDTAVLGRTIAAQLPVQVSVNVQIPTYVVVFKTLYDRVIIANWDKYIDINISTQTMTACERGGVNCRAWRVMTGKNSTPTPVGTWLVYARSKDFWMSGLERTPDYYRLWVPYATWFKGGGYAIHSASWRNNNPASSNGFGNAAYTWNGSHGCVNAPDDAAVYIYGWASNGTPVIVHN